MTLEATQLAKLLPKLDNLGKSEAEKLLAGLAGEVNKKCADDGFFWLKFAKTRDEADSVSPVKPVPLHEEYIHSLWKDLIENQVCVIAKSRQMYITWVISLFMCWWARYRPNNAVYYQTQGWPDAVEKICMPGGGYQGRCQFIEENLPSWMHVDYKASEGRIQYPNGSIIQALAGGANQVRGKTPSLYVGDEFAFQEEQEKTWTTVAPLKQKNAKFIIISTPNGSTNTFSVLYHGYPMHVGRS